MLTQLNERTTNYSYSLGLLTRFKSKLFEKYGWDNETCESKWKEALSKPTTLRSRDQMGVVVISYLQELEVGSGREIASEKAGWEL